MNRKVLAAALAAAVTGLALAGSSQPQTRLDRLSAPTRSNVAGPLLGSVQRYSPALHKQFSVLVHVSPRSLRPVPGPRVALGVHWGAWALSPDRSTLVVARDNGVSPLNFLRIVDVPAMRINRDVAMGTGYVSEIVWLGPDRLLALQYRSPGPEVVVVDPVAGAVLRRAGVPGDIVGRARSSNSLVLLVSPANRIGPARLMVIDRAGSARTVSLERTRAGFDSQAEGGEAEEVITKSRIPALAVDTLGNRAFVIAPGGPVAEVDLASLGVTYHELPESVSVLGRIHDWLEPPAAAKAIEGPVRYARWLGGGLIAVAGEDYETYVDAHGKRQARARPAGLDVIDTRSWKVRTLDRGAGEFVRAGADVLATGQTWDGGAHSLKGIGVTDYAVVTPTGEVDGRKRFQVLKGRSALVELVLGARAYVRLADAESFRIVNLATGRIVGTRAALPYLFLVE